MRINLFLCALVAFTQLIDAEDATTISESEGVNPTSSTKNGSTELFKVEAREESFDLTTIATPSSTTDSEADVNRKIPPTLLNTNIGLARENLEKPSKSLKDVG